MTKRWIRLMAVGLFLTALTPVTWGAPVEASIEVGPHGGFLAALSGLWSDLELAWSKALGVISGESSSPQSPGPEPADSTTSLDGGETCQEIGTWVGCAGDPNG